jgi:hypothetical protein
MGWRLPLGADYRIMERRRRSAGFQLEPTAGQDDLSVSMCSNSRDLNLGCRNLSVKAALFLHHRPRHSGGVGGRETDRGPAYRKLGDDETQPRQSRDPTGVDGLAWTPNSTRNT